MQPSAYRLQQLQNRHCPKCQAPAARDWTAARAEDLLPVKYSHVVFTLPAEIARIVLWNKRAVYGGAAQSISRDSGNHCRRSKTPRRACRHDQRAAYLGISADAPSPHPVIVPGGGLSPDGTRWVVCKPDFFLHVLPDRFYRIGHYGFVAGAGRKQKIAQIRAPPRKQAA
ncbi:transposase zinc-binding domain-containing protein [Epibacterium ulvae]|uniref:transposase zinc-binding domain-containing protein n=1 Tax=Epibacterium ulvae TaxID=1156985 RepID=UPI003CD0D8B8